MEFIKICACLKPVDDFTEAICSMALYQNYALGRFICTLGGSKEADKKFCLAREMYVRYLGKHAKMLESNRKKIAEKNSPATVSSSSAAKESAEGK